MLQFLFSIRYASAKLTAGFMCGAAQIKKEYKSNEYNNRGLRQNC